MLFYFSDGSKMALKGPWFKYNDKVIHCIKHEKNELPVIMPIEIKKFKYKDIPTYYVLVWRNTETNELDQETHRYVTSIYNHYEK